MFKRDKLLIIQTPKLSHTQTPQNTLQSEMCSARKKVTHREILEKSHLTIQFEANIVSHWKIISTRSIILTFATPIAV